MLSYVVFAARYIIAGLRSDDRGVTAVEYGLILALIAGVIIVALLFLGTNLSTLFNNSGNCIKAPAGCTGP